LRDEWNRINQQLDSSPPAMQQGLSPVECEIITPGIWLKHYWGRKWR
jgi:hypothetical protein